MPVSIASTGAVLLQYDDGPTAPVALSSGHNAIAPDSREYQKCADFWGRCFLGNRTKRFPIRALVHTWRC